MARLTISDLEIERNGDPFEIELDDGTVFELLDPKAIPAQQLLVFESLPPAGQLKAAIANDRGDELLQRSEVDGYFLEALMLRYAAHFGIGSRPEGRASQRTSNATARPSKQTSRRGA